MDKYKFTYKINSQSTQAQINELQFDEWVKFLEGIHHLKAFKLLHSKKQAFLKTFLDNFISFVNNYFKTESFDELKKMIDDWNAMFSDDDTVILNSIIAYRKNDLFSGGKLGNTLKYTPTSRVILWSSSTKKTPKSHKVWECKGKSYVKIKNDNKFVFKLVKEKL